MYTKLKKINEGFTIVETLIVLAIAALIITIILIAVPDLQRSARNTDILHDAQNVASGVQTYEGNNSGGVPVAAASSQAGAVVTIGGAAGTASATAHVQASDSIFFANASADKITYANPTSDTTATAIGPGGLIVDVGALCGTVGTGTYTPTASNSGVAVYYPIESSGSGSIGCIQE